jgi:hypothetical protein
MGMDTSINNTELVRVRTPLHLIYRTLLACMDGCNCPVIKIKDTTSSLMYFRFGWKKNYNSKVTTNAYLIMCDGYQKLLCSPIVRVWGNHSFSSPSSLSRPLSLSLRHLPLSPS